MEGFTDEGSRIIRGLRGMSARKDIDREWLEDHYVQKHMSARACAELCGTSHTTVVRNLKLCGIQIRTPVGAKDVPEDWLEEHYIHKRLSAYECGILFSICEVDVMEQLRTLVGCANCGRGYPVSDMCKVGDDLLCVDCHRALMMKDLFSEVI